MTEKNKTTAAHIDPLAGAAFDPAELKGAREIGGVGFEGLTWRPDLGAEFCELKDSVRLAKIAKIEHGASTVPALRGTVAVVRAYGRRAYALDVKGPAGAVRVLMPEHGAVYAALNLAVPGRSVVGAVYEGKKPIKGGKTAHQYRIGVIDGPALDEPRADAIKLETMDERKARRNGADAADVDAARAAAAAAAADAGDVGESDDLPF